MSIWIEDGVLNKQRTRVHRVFEGSGKEDSEERGGNKKSEGETKVCSICSHLVSNCKLFFFIHIYVYVKSLRCLVALGFPVASSTEGGASLDLLRR